MFELLVQHGADINRHAEERDERTSLMNLLLLFELEARIPVPAVRANEAAEHRKLTDLESVVVLDAGRLSRSHATRLLLEHASNELELADLEGSVRGIVVSVFLG
ncbi:hypothetical protein FVE85_0078 [Porphyridium purpureum]|uniref:Uncharacterized protein n=1 Tax=Porphyridium purpureum TaxID=35688 RepID=A0A5J4YXN0_PORPP|nr:hypothetical protein FVE85_0078 [Porphyridium purpureum]|eukprot:POR0838..scf208_2